MADEGDAENIQVIVRVRPLNDQERQRGDHECIHVADDGQTVRFVAAPSVRASGAVAAPPTVKALCFDAALVGSSQPDVFETTQTVQLLRDALDGYSITVFAYGQTGSGKTYTMTGPEAVADAAVDGAAPHPASGLIPRGVGALFELIASEQASGQLPGGCAVRASYLELYNEQFNDLLNPDSTNLQLRNSPQSGTFVENLLQVDCEGVQDAMMVFAEGTRNRKVGSHNLNKDSSRSHCMMTLYLDRRDGAAPGGQITFVDLAGSERLLESQSHGHAAKETGHINKSLFALGNVISALADARKRGGHIPYRDSKLTRLLMDSLGGSGRTLMLACCSPSSHHLDETTNTLTFASRAKNIANRPVQPDSGVNMLQQMQSTIRALQEENASLRRSLASGPPPPPQPSPPQQQPSPPTQPSQQPPPTSGSGAAVLNVDSAGNVVAPPAAAAPAPARPKIGISALRGSEDGEAEGLRKEVASLRDDNESLKHENDKLRASHAQVLKENAMLAQKLERLEVLFADGPR